MRLAIVFLFTATTALGSSLSELSDVRDFGAVLRAFEAIQAPTPEDRARNIEAMTYLYRSDEAAPLAEALMKDAPSSPWAWFARAAVEGARNQVEEALATTVKMMELAGPEPDDGLVRFRIEYLQYFSRYGEAYALLDSRPSSLALKIVHAQTLSMDAAENSRPEDSAKALALLQKVAEENPDSVPALFAVAFQLHGMKRQEAHAFVKRAAALTPSLGIHSTYWNILASAPGLSEAERRAELEQDIASLMKTRGDWPDLWLRIARGYEQFDDTAAAEAWRVRVIRDAAPSPEAATALYERYLAFTKQNKDVLADPKLLAQAIQLARETLAHPQLSESYRDSLSYRLLLYLDADPQTTSEAFLAALDSVRKTETDFGAAVQASVLLANRKLRLEQAQKLARMAIDKTDALIRSGQIQNEKTANRFRGLGHDALGWALLQSGDLIAARTQLLAAVELDPTMPLAHYHLGQWYEVSGKRDLAEQAYVRGMAQQSRSVNPNEAALAALRGAASVKRGRSTGAEMRRKQVLATRAATPPAAPPFRLEHLDGKPVSLASLQGKIVVVNFWGIWCGYCVEELPEVQQLARKYADRADVVVLTINNDGAPDKVRKWMRAQKYNFPVLLDGGFAEGRVKSWPTTWFIDQRGRMAFKQEGWTEHLLEEFSWRIDALTATAR